MVVVALQQGYGPHFLRVWVDLGEVGVHVGGP
jgi:hypothetical protein